MKTQKKILALGIIFSSQILPFAAQADNLVSSTGMNDIKTNATVYGGSDSELNIGDDIVIDKEDSEITDIPDSEEDDNNIYDSTETESISSDSSVIEQGQSTDGQEVASQSIQAGTWGTAKTEFDSDTGTIIVSNGVLVNGNVPPVDKGNIKHIVFGDNVQFGANVSYMFSGFSNLLTISGDADTSNATQMSYMFSSCRNLESVDVSKWDTSKVTRMNAMFSYCYNLESVDVSKWDTSKVTRMDAMFSSCYNLESLDVTNWDTSKVTTMESLFAFCYNLESLDISKWNTSKVTRMNNLFMETNNLTTIDVSNWDISNVNTIGFMFSSCYNLENLDVSKWDTSSLEDTSYTFEGTYNLTTIDVSKWDTSSLITMNAMFMDTPNLTTIDVSKWDTSNVLEMYAVFMNASSIKNLDVSNWDTSNAYVTHSMFMGTSNLTTLDVSNWDTSNVTAMNGMFSQTTNLSTLKMGSKSIFNSTVDLPGIDTSSGEMTGRWIDKTTGDTYASSTEFMDGYDGSQPGTYIWERTSLDIDIEVKDSTVYVGDSWTAEDNFVSATDKDGNVIDFDDITVEGTVDTSKAGTYKVTYSYGAITKEATIIVLENQESVTTKDSTLYVGENWTEKDNFVSATDQNGNVIDFDDMIVEGTVDTSKAGTYKVTYSWQETGSDGQPTRDLVSSEAIITVKESETEECEDETTNTGGTTSSGNTNSKTNKGNTSTLSTQPVAKSSNQSSKLPSTGEQSSMFANVIGGALLLIAGGIAFLGLRKIKKE